MGSSGVSGRKGFKGLHSPTKLGKGSTLLGESIETEERSVETLMISLLPNGAVRLVVVGDDGKYFDRAGSQEEIIPIVMFFLRGPGE